MAFAIRHGSGYLSVALWAADADRLDIPVMPTVPCGGDLEAAVSVDAACSAGTGISAVDRARTVALLGTRGSRAPDFSRPGHVAVTRVKRHSGDTAPSLEGALLQLSESVGSHPAAALVDLVGVADPTQLATLDEGAAFAATHRLATCRVGDLVSRVGRPPALRRVAEVRLAGNGEIRGVAYETAASRVQHVAFLRGDVSGSTAEVHLHVECRAGTAFGSAVCRCGGGVDDRLAQLGSGNGVVLVIRDTAADRRLAPGGAHDPSSEGSGSRECAGHPLTRWGSSVAAGILRDLGIGPSGTGAHPALV